MVLKEAAAAEVRESRKVPAEPLSETRMGARGSFYLHVSDPSQAWNLFMQAELVLGDLGYSCARGSLQTDPHPTLDFIDSFEVFMKAGRRQPELFGTVSIYGTLIKGKPTPRTMKFNPVYPHDGAEFLKTVGMALERAVPQFSKESPERDIALAISEEPEHRFPK